MVHSVLTDKESDNDNGNSHFANVARPRARSGLISRELFPGAFRCCARRWLPFCFIEYFAQDKQHRIISRTSGTESVAILLQRVWWNECRSFSLDLCGWSDAKGAATRSIRLSVVRLHHSISFVKLSFVSSAWRSCKPNLRALQNRIN